MTKRKKVGPPTVAEVAGRTAQGLRGDRKLELVARAARSAGLNWGTGRIADLEAGRVSPTLPALLQLCRAFSDLLNRPVRLAELFPGDGPVSLNASTTIDLAELRGALLGFPVVGPEPESTVATPGAGRLTKSQRDQIRRWDILNASLLEADTRLANSLGISRHRAVVAMERLWGRSFSDERDRRGGAGANPQKRGRISRDLKAELLSAISREGD